VDIAKWMLNQGIPVDQAVDHRDVHQMPWFVHVACINRFLLGNFQKWVNRKAKEEGRIYKRFGPNLECRLWFQGACYTKSA